VNAISATSAREIHSPEVSSKTASVYSIAVQASSAMLATAALTRASARTVTETCAPPASAAWTGPRPQNAESIRTRTGVVASISRRVVLTASATRRFPPRGEEHAPRRSRCATITGAASDVVAVASSAFKPRTWV
jgi:hypothetical protein